MKELTYGQKKWLFTKAMTKRLLQRTFVDKLGLERKPKKKTLGQPVYDYKTQHQIIGEMINADEPMCILRPGSAEFVSAWMRDEHNFYGLTRYRNIKIFSDVGYDEEKFDQWVNQFDEDMSIADGIVLFGTDNYMEEYLIQAYCNPKHLFQMTTLEFSAAKAKTEKSWLESLNGKKVLIVSLFADTMEKQVKNLDKIWPGINPVPNVEFIFQKSVFYLAGYNNQFATWYESLEYLDNQIKEKEFDVAILSCGPFSTFLAANIKRRGGKAIQYGGSLQLLFGIKGNRWDNMPISKFYNEYWVKPSAEEKPDGADALENACYW